MWLRSTCYLGFELGRSGCYKTLLKVLQHTEADTTILWKGNLLYIAIANVRMKCLNKQTMTKYFIVVKDDCCDFCGMPNHFSGTASDEHALFHFFLFQTKSVIKVAGAQRPWSTSTSFPSQPCAFLENSTMQA